MKTINYFLMISAAVLGAACTESIDAISLPEKEITLTATRENLDPGTKSFRLDDGSVWWSPKEEVSVFYGSGTNGGSKFTSNNTTLAETTEFEGSISMSGNKEFWAVYPYSAENSCDGSSIVTVIPSRQTGSEGNFSDDVFPAIGKSNSLTMAFWNICGGIKFFVSRTDIQSVTIKGNNGETLAGKVKVAFNAGGKPELTEVLDGQTEVTLIAPDDGCFKPGKYYYITLLPIALDGGITLTFYTSSEKGEIVSDKAQTVKRSIFGVLKNIDAKVSEWESTVAEPEWVDLGLSVKWATFNVGASKPEEHGDYFAWGETEPKTDYSWLTYKYELGTDSHGPFSKYVTKTSYGSVDYKTVLDPEDDAAHVNWGGDWRMPTDADWTELMDNCTWTWTSENGVNGILVTSKTNGKSIFLPAAGRRYDTNLYDAGSYGGYWSSFHYTGTPFYAKSAYFYSDKFSRGMSFRYYGKPIRAVNGEFIRVSSISLDKTSFEMNGGVSMQLTATISPANATVKDVLWTSSDESVATVDENGLVLAGAPGTAYITVYGSSGVSATCFVTVKEIVMPNSLEAVDLGLPSGLKWASCNLGAYNPEESGSYFAWGETEPKSYYKASTYKWCNGDYKKLTKYCTQSDYWDGSGSPDNKTVLDPEDDAAHIYWGGNWKMPTEKDEKELITNCNWTWTSDYKGTGVSGMIVSGTKTGYTDKSIFIPAAGYRSYEKLYNVGAYGEYWSSSVATKYPDESYNILFSSTRVNTSPSISIRDNGLPVRPVFDDRIYPQSVSLNKSSMSLYIGRSELLTATVLPENAADKTVTWSSDNMDVVTVDVGGNVTALKEGTATITATSTLGGKTAACVVTVTKAVDLGLPSGLKWAAINVGAIKPEDYGDYFAWGETEPKTDYSWSTYKWCNGSSTSLTKYNTNSSYGTVDNKTVLDPEDDAAHVNWGGSWRMPTKEEQDELRNNCTWTWTTQNGVNGRLVTGPSGKSIFLPAAGYWYGTLLIGAGSYGDYWSSSINTGGPGGACIVDFLSGSVDWGSDYRYNGQSVRPVSE